MDINQIIKEEIAKQVDAKLDRLDEFITKISGTKEQEKYYRIKELSEYLKISEYTIGEYIRAGKLQSHRFGKIHIISETQLKAFLKNQNN